MFYRIRSVIFSASVHSWKCYDRSMKQTVKTELLHPEWNYLVLLMIVSAGCLVFLLTANSSDPVLVPGSWLIIAVTLLLLMMKLFPSNRQD